MENIFNQVVNYLANQCNMVLRPAIKLKFLAYSKSKPRKNRKPVVDYFGKE